MMPSACMHAVCVCCHTAVRTGVVTHTMVVSLYNLQKEGGAVLHGLGEDLKEVAIVVKVHKNLQLPQLQVSTQ